MANTVTATKTLMYTRTVNAVAAGTTLDMGELPGGHRVLRAALYNSAVGTGVTATLGDTADNDRFIAAASVATAGKLSMTDTLAGGAGYLVPSSTRLVVLTGGATSAATDQTLRAVVELVEDYE